MAKKIFSERNPALQFIETKDNHVVHTANVESVAHRKEPKNPASGLLAETKSRRINLLVRPSLFEDAAKIAHMKRISVNELLNIALTALCESEKSAIQEYDKVFGDT